MNDRQTANRVLLALPDPDFQSVWEHLEPVELERGKIIYRDGEPVSHLYFVDRGLISRVKTMVDGRMVEIGVIGVEGVSGVYTLFGMNIAILESIVQIPGKAFRAHRDVIDNCMGSSDSLRNILMKYAYFTVNEFAQTAACNRLHSVEERCCRWFLISHDNARSRTFPLTHEFLSMMLGVNRTTVSLTASFLQRAGLIEYTRGRVTIVDRAGLESTSCECYQTMRDAFNRLFGAPG